MGAYEMLPPGDIALIKFLGRPHTRGVCCWGDLDRFLKKFPYHPYIKQGGGYGTHSRHCFPGPKNSQRGRVAIGQADGYDGREARLASGKSPPAKMPASRNFCKEV